MKKFSQNPIIYIIIMGLTNALLFFGIFFCKKYPKEFFFGILLLFSIVVALYIATTKKDCLLLIGGMLIFSIYSQSLDSFLSRHCSGIAHFIIFIFLAFPVFCPIYFHLTKMIYRRKKINKET